MESTAKAPRNGIKEAKASEANDILHYTVIFAAEGSSFALFRLK